MNELPLGYIYIYFLFYSAQRWTISCTPCSEDCSLCLFFFAIVFFVAAHLCYKQGSISEQTRTKQHTNCRLANNCSLPCPITSGIHCTVRLSRVESVKKNGIMFVGKPRTGDPVTVLTTHVYRENCPPYNRACQRWF
jgi:hypothetical protein